MGIVLISLNGTVKYGSIVNYRSHIFYLENKKCYKTDFKKHLEIGISLHSIFDN